MRQKSLSKKAKQGEDGQKEKLIPSSQKTLDILPTYLWTPNMGLPKSRQEEWYQVMKERQTMHLPSKGKFLGLWKLWWRMTWQRQMWLEWRATQRKMSTFVVGCMQETVGKSWGRERREERAVRKDLEDVMWKKHVYFLQVKIKTRPMRNSLQD